MYCLYGHGYDAVFLLEKSPWVHDMMCMCPSGHCPISLPFGIFTSRWFPNFHSGRRCTLPEANIALKIGHPKRKLVFQPSMFRGYVSVREDRYISFLAGFDGISMPADVFFMGPTSCFQRVNGAESELQKLSPFPPFFRGGCDTHFGKVN